MCEMCDLAMTSATEQPPARTRYRVTGMQGAACAARIDTAVRLVPGVQDASVSATSGEIVVHHAADTSLGIAVETAVAGLGYQLSLISEAQAVQNIRDGKSDRRVNPRRPSWFRDILDLIAGRDRSAMPLASAGRPLER